MARRCSTRRGSAGSRASWPSACKAPYRPGRRSDDWRKIKLREEATLLIAGYTSGQGARARLGALLLATDDLEYAGNCGSGLSDEDIRELLARLEPLRRETSPLRGAPQPGRRGAVARHLGRAGARVRGGVHRVDARSPLARPRLQAPRGGGCREGARRAALARAEAHQPGQGVLPRREDHQGRPARLLPLGRGRARAVPARPPDHARALPGRHHGQALLPEAGARARARLDAHGDAAEQLRRPRQGRSTT